MSPLAFDKQGKPFTFQRRTKKLLVRLFRNPSARGTCCQVLGADGLPLYVDPETDYVELRRAVGQVPGLYRLDQCDENGGELEDAQAAYVSIDVTRNAQGGDMGGGDISPLVIIQQMAAQQAEVMKAMAAQQSALLAATAEILRAPYRPAPIAAATTELRNSEGGGRVEDEEEEIEEATPENPTTVALRMLEPHLPALGAFLYDKCAEFLRHVYKKDSAAAPAASVSTPVLVPAVVAVPAPPVVVASSPEPQAAPAVTPSPTIDVPAQTSLDLGAETSASTRNAMPTQSSALNVPPIPTREQLAHLTAIRARLSPTEQAIAQNTVSRMEPQMLASWLEALSSMSVEEATELIRQMVSEVQSKAR